MRGAGKVNGAASRKDVVLDGAVLSSSTLLPSRRWSRAGRDGFGYDTAGYSVLFGTVGVTAMYYMGGMQGGERDMKGHGS